MLSLLIRAQVWLAYWWGRIAFGVPRSRGDQPIDLTQVKRVLVLRPDEIGDLVLTTPFLRELRRLLPDAWITLLVNPVTYNLVERCQYLNQILVYDQQVSRCRRPFIMPWRALKLAHRWLRSQHFDLALFPRWDTDGYYSAFVTYFSCSVGRVSYSERVNVRKQKLNRGFDRLSTHILNDCNPKHEVERSLDLVRYLGGRVQDDHLELWLSAEDEEFARRMLGSGYPRSSLLVSFSPGASAAQRQWPIENFIALGAWLKQYYQGNILVVGGRADQPLGLQVARALGDSVIDMTGHATLRQTAALLKHCHLYVGNDSGPMHLAAAVGIPIVEISSFPRGGPSWHWNSPVRFGPWGIPNRILQPENASPPCREACLATKPHCILDVTVERVQRAVTEIRTGASAPGLITPTAWNTHRK